MRKINVPQITSIENAISIYYNHSELGNDEIKELFGQKSPTTISKLKKHVRDEMFQRKVFSFGANTVNTEIAFETWGLKISDLEERLTKLQQLGLSS